MISLSLYILYKYKKPDVAPFPNEATKNLDSLTRWHYLMIVKPIAQICLLQSWVLHPLQSSVIVLQFSSWCLLLHHSLSNYPSLNLAGSSFRHGIRKEYLDK